MSKKSYIKRPEWMDKLEEEVEKIIHTGIRERYQLSEDDEIPRFDYMSIEHNVNDSSIIFTIRVYKNPDDPGIMTVKYWGKS